MQFSKYEKNSLTSFFCRYFLPHIFERHIFNPKKIFWEHTISFSEPKLYQQGENTEKNKDLVIHVSHFVELPND